MHVQKLEPALFVFEFIGHSVHIATSFERNVPAGQTIEREKKKRFCYFSKINIF